MDFFKVLIVGGGAAGLAAAKTLGSSIDFCLLEASNYLGGRIRTVDARSNIFVDLGAQYIHGHTNNLVYQICRDLNCILEEDEPTAQNFLVVTTDQQSIDSNKIIKAFDLFEGVLADARALFTQRSTPTNASFADYLFKNFQNRLEKSMPNEKDLFDAILNYVDQSELIENGCSSLSQLSLAEYGSFEYLPGSYSTTFKNGGYRSLINYLQSQINDQRRIRFDSEVIRVRFHSDKHQLEVQIRHRNQSKISTMFCEHIIWTSSLGYLKKNFRTIFADEPKLIEEKQTAIDNLGFDTVNKVILMYEKRFWSPETKHIVLLHTKEISSIQWSDSFKAKQVNEKTLKALVRAIHRYDILPSSDIPILICWFGGDAAVLIEDFDDELIGEICHEILCFYLQIEADAHRPKHILKSEWHKNEFICGSYSYYSVRSTNDDGKRLRQVYQPDGIPRIQFAGEATHEQFYSSVHGAMESGVREGNDLLSYLKEN